MVRTGLFIAAGAVIGFLYSHFIGCRTGACPLTSNPFVSALYGAVLGLLMAR